MRDIIPTFVGLAFVSNHSFEFAPRNRVLFFQKVIEFCEKRIIGTRKSDHKERFISRV